MSDKYCQVCQETYSGHSNTIEIMESNGANKIHISGHVVCIDQLYDEIKMIKNLDKLSPKQVLKKVKFKS